MSAEEPSETGDGAGVAVVLVDHRRPPPFSQKRTQAEGSERSRLARRFRSHLLYRSLTLPQVWRFQRRQRRYFQAGQLVDQW